MRVAGNTALGDARRLVVCLFLLRPPESAQTHARTGAHSNGPARSSTSPCRRPAGLHLWRRIAARAAAGRLHPGAPPAKSQMRAAALQRQRLPRAAAPAGFSFGTAAAATPLRPRRHQLLLWCSGNQACGCRAASTNDFSFGRRLCSGPGSCSGGGWVPARPLPPPGRRRAVLLWHARHPGGGIAAAPRAAPAAAPAPVASPLAHQSPSRRRALAAAAAAARRPPRRRLPPRSPAAALPPPRLRRRRLCRGGL